MVETPDPAYQPAMDVYKRLSEKPLYKKVADRILGAGSNRDPKILKEKLDQIENTPESELENIVWGSNKNEHRPTAGTQSSQQNLYIGLGGMLVSALAFATSPLLGIAALAATSLVIYENRQSARKTA